MNPKPAATSRTSQLKRHLGRVVVALGPVALIVVEVAGRFIP